MGVTTEVQREEVFKLSSDAEEWLYEDGYSADLATMEDKYAEISEPMEKILFRLSEMTARPAAILALNEKLDKIEKLMTKWETTHSHITEEERGGVLEKVEEVKKWIVEEEEQSKLAGSDDPVFTSEECPGQTKSIESMVSRLSRKPKPKPVVEETSDSDSNETKSEEGSKTDEEEPSSEDSKEEEGSEKPAEESTEDEAKDEATSDEL